MNFLDERTPGDSAPNPTLDRVLEGLRETGPPADLSDNILRALARRSSQAPFWRRRWPAATGRSLSWTAAATAVLVLLTAEFAFFRAPRQGRRPELVRLSPVANPAATPHPLPQRESTLRATSARPSPAAATRTRALPARPVLMAAVPAVLSTAGALALEETRAPSHPAPQPPLTEQERLLLRIAHRNDPVQIAALDPIARATRNAADKAAVQQFFVDPTPAPQKEPTP